MPAPRIVLLVTSPRVVPGVLTWDAWAVLRAGVVMTRDQDHPQRAALHAAGIATESVDPDHPPQAVARILLAAARESGTAVWLAGSGGDDDVARALAETATRAADTGEAIEIEVVHGSWDVPGSRLLDVVATMDRLRSPGGCPWDAKQTHDSLAPYLLEEAYEAFEAIEEQDSAALREELGDVLLQVAFHARLAEENDGDERWTIDDVAAGLVDKLVRRHPHVFADREVSGAEEVVRNWEAIKAEEKGRVSAVEGVAMSAPALTLAATLQRKALRLGVPADLVSASLPPEVAGATTDATSAGALLWSAVDALRAADLDAEAALRARAREFRDRLARVERDLHAAGRDPHEVTEREWRVLWEAAAAPATCQDVSEP